MSVTVSVNGEPHALDDGTTVRGLLERLELAPEKVAVERNGELVRRADHARVVLAEADVLEIVTLVGGG